MVAPVLEVAGLPVRLAAATLIKLIRPVASPALEVYARVSPEGDRRLLGRPEFKAMFLDDLLNGSRKQLAAPFADVVVFARPWGFRLDEVKVPVLWWHGDRDHIIPFEHGRARRRRTARRHDACDPRREPPRRPRPRRGDHADRDDALGPRRGKVTEHI